MKANTFTLNGKTVTAAPFTYNTICDMDDMGVSMADITTKTNAFVRCYVAICIKKDKEAAGRELEAHIIGGGTLEPIIEAMTKEMNASDFFQALQQKTTEKNQKSEK